MSDGKTAGARESAGDLAGAPDAVEAPGLATGLSLRRSALERVADAQRALLDTRGLRGLSRCLLTQLPAAFGGQRAELHLHDPDGELSELVELRRLNHVDVTLWKDSEALYRLYPDRPAAALLSIDDERMFSILTTETELPAAVMMPLFDGVRIVGSYHVALGDACADWGEGESEKFSLLAQLVSSALWQAIDYEKAQDLTFVDPVTEVGNLRAFRRDMQRELSWAKRVGQPLSLAYVALDDLEELCRNFGEVACRFLQRRVSQRLCSALRATDYIAHIAVPRFAVLLPACGAQHAQQIAERLRRDIESFPIDDGRGAVLYVTLSIGLISWDPEVHGLHSVERLAEQLEAEALAAMERMQAGGGNAVAVAEPEPMMV